MSRSPSRRRCRPTWKIRLLSCETRLQERCCRANISFPSKDSLIMLVAKVELPGGEQRVAVLVENGVYIVAWSEVCRSLTDLLHSENPVDLVGSLFDSNATLIAAPQVRMLAPLDQQEV